MRAGENLWAIQTKSLIAMGTGLFNDACQIQCIGFQVVCKQTRSDYFNCCLGEALCLQTFIKFHQSSGKEDDIFLDVEDFSRTLSKVNERTSNKT